MSNEIFEQSYIQPIPSGQEALVNNGDSFVATATLQSANYSGQSTTNSSGWQLNQNGDSNFNNVVIKGKITATAGGVIGGFNINTNSLTDTGDTFGFDSTITGGDDIRLYAGATNANKGTAPFRVSEAGVLTASSGTIGGWILGATTLSITGLILDAGNKLITLGASSEISIDGANKKIVSSNYQTGTSGFYIDSNLVEAENIIARGTLRGSVFAYDVVSAIGGQLIVCNASTLSSDMTALDASTLTIKNDTTFAVNDILVMRGVATSGIVEEWMRVTNIGSAPTYTVTRDLAGLFATNTNPIWKAGTPVVKQGKSDGSSAYSGGWLRLIGEGTNSPYYSVFARTGLLYNNYSEYCRLGNLNGIGNYSSDTWGLYLGSVASGNYLQYDNVSGNLVVNDSTISNQDIYGDGSDGDVTISSNTTLTSDKYYNNLTINNSIYLNAGGYRIFVKGTLTNNGLLHRNGNYGTNGSGQTKGAGGAALSTGTLYGGLAGKDGGDGGGNSASGNPGGNGDNQTESFTSAGSNGGTGTNSGFGTIAGGTGGTITATIQPPRTLSFIQLMREFSSDNTVKYIKTSAGSGGGSGGGGGGGYGGGGGGSGGSGGIMTIFSKKIINSGTISCNGGAGGNGADGSGTGSGCGGGGGGGGGGGVLTLIYSILTNTGTISAAGGAKGNKGLGKLGGVDGGDGIVGNAGKIIQLVK